MSSGESAVRTLLGELYRKFGIASYKMRPARRFQEAMRFLSEWHEIGVTQLNRFGLYNLSSELDESSGQEGQRLIT